MSERSTPTLTESFNADFRHRFYEDRRSLALLMILIVFLAPFAGLYVASLPGAVIGVLLSFATYYLTPFLLSRIGG